MLTKLIIRNFKRFDEVEIELGNPVVFIGPNNSGKTTALQALTLWETGVKRLSEKRKDERKSHEKRPGVAINRLDFLSAPISKTSFFWRGLHLRTTKATETGKRLVENVLVEIILHGITGNEEWQCGLEFDYINKESFYCRPLRIQGENNSRMEIPEPAQKVQIAFLPPMSGLASNEVRLDPGTINVKIGEGRTAEVLRNLSHKLYENAPEKWGKLKKRMIELFNSELEPPAYIPERGEITMQYIEAAVRLDISSSGRGLQQTLLLLSYMYANPGAVLLLDEPDAHLEILRQRQIYRVLTEVAQENGNQLIIASHSEVLLNEAAGKDKVVAFVGRPHTITSGSQVLKSLRDIGWEHYYQAQETGWVLYLEGSTDLAILQTLADTLGFEEAKKALERPYIHYVGNNVKEAQSHFHGLKEAIPGLLGVAVFDNLDRLPPSDEGLDIQIWQKREIENYLCYPDVLEAYASKIGMADSPGPLFEQAIIQKHIEAMRKNIKEMEDALKKMKRGGPWDGKMKVSDEFLGPLFEDFYKDIKQYNIMPKKSFHDLARFITKDSIDPEVKEKLQSIVAVAEKAKPMK